MREEITFSGVCLVTDDVRRLSAFYQAVLGVGSDGDSDAHQLLATRGAEISLLRRADAAANSGMAFTGGSAGNPNMTLTFTVDDAYAAYDHLLTQGVQVMEPPVARPWGAVNLRFTDPDGNYVVFRSFPKAGG